MFVVLLLSLGIVHCVPRVAESDVITRSDQNGGENVQNGVTVLPEVSTASDVLTSAEEIAEMFSNRTDSSDNQESAIDYNTTVNFIDAQSDVPYETTVLSNDNNVNLLPVNIVNSSESDQIYENLGVTQIADHSTDVPNVDSVSSNVNIIDLVPDLSLYTNNTSANNDEDETPIDDEIELYDSQPGNSYSFATPPAVTNKKFASSLVKNLANSKLKERTIVPGLEDLLTLSNSRQPDFSKKTCETSGECLPPANSSLTCFGTDLGYRQTSLFLSQKENLNQVLEELDKWKVLQNIPRCWKVIQPLLCSVYFPKCENNRVQLVHTNLCKAIKTSCKLVPDLNPSWTNIFDCDSFRYSDCKNDEKSERLRFNSTTFCPYPLISTQNTEYFFDGVEECGMPCETPLYTQSQYARFHLIITVAGIVSIISCFFAIATFLIDWSGSSKYPAVAIFYINVCCFLATVGWLVQLGGKDTVVCRRDGTLRTQEPGSGDNLTCVIVFILIYYFSIAAGVWLVILTYTWSVFFTSNAKVKDLIEPKTAYFHMSAWSFPAVLTVIILAMNQVQADSSYGICFLGYSNMYSRIFFLFLPFSFFAVLSEYNSMRCILFLSRLYHTPDYLSTKESTKVKATLIRISLFSAVIALCVLVSFLCQIYEFAGRDSWDSSLDDLVFCGLKSQIDDGDPYSCHLKNKPNPVVTEVHVICVFVAYLLASSWIYTKESLGNWQLFLSQLMTRKKAERPVKLKKHEMIAQAYGKRRQLEETGRLSLTLQSLHNNPVGIYQEGELEDNDDVSSTWAAALPYLVQRRGAGCGAEQLGLVPGSGTGGGRDSSLGVRGRRNSMESNNSFISSQSYSIRSNRFGWGDSSKIHSVDSQSVHMSDIERLQSIYDETVKKSKKRSKRNFFRSHANKMRPWSRLSRQGSTASGISTRSSRSRRDSTYSESSMNSQILPAITLDPTKLNNRFKRPEYTVPKPGQSTDFGKDSKMLAANLEDPSFRELEEKLKKLADTSRASLTNERESLRTKDDQGNPATITSMSRSIQTSLTDLTASCHQCAGQHASKSTGTQMTPKLSPRNQSESEKSKDRKPPKTNNQLFEESSLEASSSQPRQSSTDNSSSQQLLKQGICLDKQLRSAPNKSSSEMSNSQQLKGSSSDQNSSQPLQHIEANVVSIKVLGPSSEDSSIPSSFEKDFKMKKINSAKKKEKENIEVNNDETSELTMREIEIPSLKGISSSTGPLIRQRDHFRGRRGAIVEKLSPKGEK